MGHNGSAVGRSPKISELEDRSCAWMLPGSGALFTMPASVVTQLKAKVTAGLLLLPKRGAEVGGILLGRVVEREPLAVDITGFEPVPCEYRFGPTFVLSETDRAGLRPILARLTAHREDSVVGFYRSCTGRQQSLDSADLELLENYFPGPDAIVMSIKPISLRESEVWFFHLQNGLMPTEPTHPALPFDETSKVEALSSTSLEAPAGLALIAEHEVLTEPAPEVAEGFLETGGEQLPLDVEGTPEAVVVAPEPEVVFDAAAVSAHVDESEAEDRVPEPAVVVDAAAASARVDAGAAEVVFDSATVVPHAENRVREPVEVVDAAAVSARVDEGDAAAVFESAAAAPHAEVRVPEPAEVVFDSATVVPDAVDRVPAPLEVVDAAAVSARVDEGEAEVSPPRERSSWPWIVVTCILLAVAGAVFYVVTSTGPSEAPPPAAVVETPTQNQPPVAEPARAPAAPPVAAPAKPLPAVVSAAVTEQATPDVPAGIRARVESPVIINVQVFVDAAGRVTGAVAQGDGNSVFRFLAERAVSAAQASRFKPGRAANGTPAPSTAVLTYVFEPEKR